MALDDFLSPEVGVAVGLTSLLSNAKVRAQARRGLVLGLAGTLAAWDGVRAFAAGFNPAPAAGGTPANQEAQQQVQEGPRRSRSVHKGAQGDNDER